MRGTYLNILQIFSKNPRLPNLIEWKYLYVIFFFSLYMYLLPITYGISIEVCNKGVHNSGMRKGISAKKIASMSVLKLTSKNN